MIVEALAKLIERQDLSREESAEVFREIMSGKATQAQLGAYLVAGRMKGESVAEIAGAAEVMREMATTVKVSNPDCVDTCGTGGDHSGTFNVSTAAAFVAAGAGVSIAKHGNRSVSSKSGSADVLKALGVNLELTAEQAGECVDSVGIGFLFAPLLHGAMKHAIGARREIAQRSIFNLLGPLTNPAGAMRQVMGVFSKDLTEPLAEVLGSLGAKHVWLVHGLEGLDELSMCGKSQVSEFTDGELKTFEFDPKDYGFEYAEQSQLKADSIEESAEIIKSVFDGTKGPCRDIVVLNAAAAILVSGNAKSFEEAVEMAKSSLDSGKAKSTLEALCEMTAGFSKEGEK